jgi:iron complex transport system substrate-binding protein
MSHLQTSLPRLHRILLCVLSLLLAAVLLASCSSVQTTQTPLETQTVTDSAGRTVTLPKDVRRIAPSGAYAQIFLYTLCPDKMIGLSGAYSDTQKQYIQKKYWDLPVFGQFYNKNATMNLEAVIKAKPDVIIDMGEPKADIASDMDGLQEQTGIPVIFIEATMRSMADAYDKLGEILSLQARASELSSYLRNTLAFADACTAKVPEDKRVRVLYGSGEYGLSVMGKGSIHAEVLNAAGADNVAVLDRVSDSGGDTVSMEQVLSWAPDVVVLAPDGSYGDVLDDATWKNVPAVQTGRVYEIPLGPYSWLDRPPSVQRVLGVLWLGNLLYPDLYNFDMMQKTREFYKLFWRYDLTEAAARALLNNSTLKQAGAS